MLPLRRLFAVRLSTAALALIVLVVIGGLIAADSALRRADAAATRDDAAEIAQVAEALLAIRVKSLVAFRVLYVTNDVEAMDEPAFDRLVHALGGHLGDFRRVFVTDSAGVVRRSYAFGPAVPRLERLQLDLDTLSLLGMRRVAARARMTGRTQVSTPGELLSGDRGFMLVEPVIVDGRFRGFIGGAVTTDAMLTGAMRDLGRRNLGVVILADGDTVVSHALAEHVRTVNAETVMQVPDGEQWRIAVQHPAQVLRVRGLLWTIGVGALLVLTVGLLRERRQAQRVADRSSELERLSTELLRANRAKSEFLANVSHELRTPLNAIVGFVELLRDGVYGELTSRQVAPVDRIAASATHLRHLVDQILDLGKMAAGRLEVQLEPINVRAFVLDILAEVEPLIAEKELNLSIAVGSTLPRVRTDPTHLRQILVNLLGNAIKFTVTGGIAVRAHLVGSGTEATGERRPLSSPEGQTRAAPDPGRPWLALQVADTGMGIAPADHERIFEEFEQVNAGPRGESMLRGTGLGLPISRRLARLLGGDLTVESELAKGSTFTVWLPLHPSDIAEAADRRRTPLVQAAVDGESAPAAS